LLVSNLFSWGPSNLIILSNFYPFKTILKNQCMKMKKPFMECFTLKDSMFFNHIFIGNTILMENTHSLIVVVKFYHIMFDWSPFGLQIFNWALSKTNRPIIVELFSLKKLIILHISCDRILGHMMSRPQVPCRPTWGSKYAAMRKELELGARSRLPALEGVRGAC
jgi:hypothetical protein